MNKISYKSNFIAGFSIKMVCRKIWSHDQVNMTCVKIKHLNNSAAFKNHYCVSEVFIIFLVLTKLHLKYTILSFMLTLNLKIVLNLPEWA